MANTASSCLSNPVADAVCKPAELSIHLMTCKLQAIRLSLPAFAPATEALSLTSKNLLDSLIDSGTTFVIYFNH